LRDKKTCLADFIALAIQFKSAQKAFIRKIIICQFFLELI